jgi:sugar phosphate isomerase/epimerase
MRVGISTACFYPYVNTEDTLDIIKDLGFNLCEVFMEAESEMNQSFCYDLRNKAEKLGIEIYSVHAFNATFEPFLFDRYERRRKEMEDKYIKTCIAGEILGAKYYTFHGATSSMPIGNINDIVSRIGNLCKLAKANNISLSQENVSWCKSKDPEYIRILKDNLKDNLNFTLDIKQSVRSLKTPMEFLHIYNEGPSTVHINDATTDASCLLPGCGKMNLKEIIEEVTKIDKSIPYIIEVYCENYNKYEELGQAKEHLLKLGINNS